MMSHTIQNFTHFFLKKHPLVIIHYVTALQLQKMEILETSVSQTYRLASKEKTGVNQLMSLLPEFTKCCQ